MTHPELLRSSLTCQGNPVFVGDITKITIRLVPDELQEGMPFGNSSGLALNLPASALDKLQDNLSHRFCWIYSYADPVIRRWTFASHDEVVVLGNSITVNIPYSLVRCGIGLRNQGKYENQNHTERQAPTQRTFRSPRNSLLGDVW